jgi:hypothetical protein
MNHTEVYLSRLTNEELDVLERVLRKAEDMKPEAPRTDEMVKLLPVTTEVHRVPEVTVGARQADRSSPSPTTSPTRVIR